ncbi:MAG: hypothetical protein K8S14_03995 [Actinomycetia bacterium]|nr:hypothetical protein [Actinomycetes bacterium]
MKRKSVKMIMSLIAGLVLFSIMGMACTGELNADSLENNGSGHAPILERIAEKFGLDIDEVKDFLEELKKERRSGIEERFEERLDELVKDEKITGDQKKAILEKKEEMEAFREELENMKVFEAREAVKEMREELKDWAEENDLELRYLFPEIGPRKLNMGSKRSFRPGFRL